MIVERCHAVHRIHGSQHAIKPENLREKRMTHDRMQHRGRIGKPRGFDDDALQRLDAAGLQPVDEIGQRIDQFTAHCAAQTPVSQLDHALARLLDQQMVNAHLAELVDNDCCIAERRIFQKPVEQRRLAGAKKAGQHGNGNGIRHIS